MVGGKLLCTYMQDPSHHVYMYDLLEKIQEISLPSFEAFMIWRKKKDKEVFYTFTSFTYPPSITGIIWKPILQLCSAAAK